MPRIFIVRVVALLLLLMAGAAVYACDLSDACASTAAGCDDPGGDACICCCHHIVPVIAFALQPGDVVRLEEQREPATQVLTTTFPIYHPPQA